MTTSESNQALLKAVKKQTRMKNAAFAAAFGFNERTLKSWLLPITSPGHRGIPEDAVNLLLRSQFPQDTSRHFSGFDAGESAGSQAIVSADELVEFPLMYLVARRETALEANGVKFFLHCKDGKTYKKDIETTLIYDISFSKEQPEFDGSRKLISVEPFTRLTPSLADKLGPALAYVHELNSAEMVIGFQEAILHAAIRSKDSDLYSTLIQCVFKGRYFVAYLAKPLEGAMVQNFTRYETLPHWKNKPESTWISCIDINGEFVDESPVLPGDDDLLSEGDWQLIPEKQAKKLTDSGEAVYVL